MTPRSILLIEPDADLREILRLCLTDIPYWHIVAVDSIAIARHHIRTQSIDLIVLSTATDASSYPHLVQSLSPLTPHPLPPLIFITSKESSLPPKQLQTIGILGEIIQPLDPLTLHLQIAKLSNW